MTSLLVPDLTYIINQDVLDFIHSNPREEGYGILLCDSIISHIEDLAAREDPSGLLALNHLKMVSDGIAGSDTTVRVIDTGDWSRDVSLSEICRKVARDEGALLVTCDPIQEILAKVEGITVKRENLHVEAPIEQVFSQLFDDETMSIHLAENQIPRGKKGMPGAWNLVPVSEEPTGRKMLSKMANEILNLTNVKGENRGFLEIDYEGAKVVQFGTYRIAIAYPPVSKNYEITVTRPLVKLEMDYYNLPQYMVDRFRSEADGILVAGPPGAGKSTFASALANYYSENDKIVKTLESVRDLQVNPEITQYGAIEGEMEKNADLLLLVRPDYTIFDEVRKTDDFEIFVDLRQSGVGMVGVVHASTPIDSIQRFINRVDLGVLPQIIDTIVFVKDGAIDDIMGVRMVVRIPTGFRDDGLARPVIEVFSYSNTSNPLYEIYTFGENTVIVPLTRRASRGKPHRRGAYNTYDDPGNDMYPIDGIRNTKNVIEFYFGHRLANNTVLICSKDGRPIISGTISSKGTLRLKKSGSLGREVSNLLRKRQRLYYRVQ
ncbi:MAG: ATPase, T2SS/T4P/T4SS family [Promethearchaeota archaeon]